MHPSVRRGYVENDRRDFADEQVKRLLKAQKDLIYLIDHGYDLKHSVTFTGDRFQFSKRQRMALARATVKSENQTLRQQKCIRLKDADILYIDGFNLIITLEAALSPETTIFRCMDRTIRDLCGLRGNYKLIESTTVSLHMVGELLKDAKAEQVIFYLDQPVSNSGRLKVEILEVMAQYDIPVRVELVPNADVELRGKTGVVSSDSMVLDECESWVNLAGRIIAENFPKRHIIDLSNLTD